MVCWLFPVGLPGALRLRIPKRQHLDVFSDERLNHPIGCAAPIAANLSDIVTQVSTLTLMPSVPCVGHHTLFPDVSALVI
jgi:hypothetical protein